MKENFCLDNETTYRIDGNYPTWHWAKAKCEASGGFLPTYEQHKLGAKSTSSSVVKNSGHWEWVLNSDGDNRQGQLGGFFYNDINRFYGDGLRLHADPEVPRGDVAFRCGGVPLPQDSPPKAGK